MPRIYLKAAREKRELSQASLAKIIKVERKAVSRWELGENEPQSAQKEAIRAALRNDDPHLFDIVSSNIVPCHELGLHDRMSSSDSTSDLICVPESVRGLRELMDMFRRQFNAWLLKFGGASLFGNVSLALVPTPSIEPEEYLSQAAATIDFCWEALNQGNFYKVERALHANLPTLTRLAHTIAPYQSLAANLAVQAKFIQKSLAIVKHDFFAQETYCVEAVHFAQLSGSSMLLSIALDEQGMTYVRMNQPSRAIPLFNTALSLLGSDSLLVKSALSIDLSVAYAMDTTLENRESLARDYVEQAHTSMPSYPELDPFYQSVRMGPSELEQAEGNVYLHLAEHFPTCGYGERAYDVFNQATAKPSLSLGYRVQALTRKADSLRVLGQMDESVKCLVDSLPIAVKMNSQKALSEIAKVLGGVPECYKRETVAQNLQKDLSQTLIVARR